VSSALALQNRAGGPAHILAVPFAPQELLARANVISRAAPSTDGSARPA